MGSLYTGDGIFVIKSTKNEAISREILELIKKLTDESWKIPYATRVDSITNYQHIEAKGDLLTIRDLFSSSDQLNIDHIKKVVFQEPSLVNRLISKDGKTTGILVSLQLPPENPFATSESVEYAENLAEKFKELNPDIRIAITGLAPISNAYPRAAKRDLEILVPIMYGLLIFFIFIFIRSFTGTLVTLLIVKFSSDVAMGVAGWIGIKLTAPTSNAPIIIMSIAVADCIQFVITTLYYMQEGKNRNEAIIESFSANIIPIFVTSITTIMGFLALNFSASPPFHDLGNIVAIGATFELFLAVTFLPALLSLLPIDLRFYSNYHFKFIGNLGDLVIKRNNIIFYIIIIITIFSISLIPKNKIDDHIIEYFDKTFRERVDSEFTLENLTGIYQMEFSIDSGKSFGIADYNYLKKLEQFTNWLRSQPEIIHVNSFTDTIKRLNKSMHSDNNSFYKIPEDNEMTSQYLLLYEMSLPYGLDLTSQLNIDRSSSRLIATLSKLSTMEIIELKKRAEYWLKTNNLSKNNAIGTGLIVVMSYITHHNINHMLWGTLISFFFITITLMISLKSIKLGFLSLIPNILPVAFAFGIYAIIDGTISTPIANVTVICLGIIVDDTVYILSKYNRAKRQLKFDTKQALHYSLSTVGPGVWMTSIVLIIGFMVQTFSPFKMNSDLGMLSAIIITSALIFDFFFLPALIIKFDEIRKHFLVKISN